MAVTTAAGRIHIHLDPLGGLAGDMFVAAVLDAFPELAPTVFESVAALGLGPAAGCGLEHHRDGALVGRRFTVGHAAGSPAPAHDHHHAAPAHDHVHGEIASRGHDERHGPHVHRSWASIRELIERSTLAAGVKRRAIAIFGLLAEAEARVHGVATDAVTFHEVGAVDSICDIVAAAELIEALDASWSVAALPLGSGRVNTAHGWLPIPAPATVLLLQGLPTIDDGVPGERVTPTGAAIARHLTAHGRPRSGPRIIERTGAGFGTRVLAGLSNYVRLIAFRAAAPDSATAHRELAVLAFELDDQSPEDLAIGLERLRAIDGIHDVIHMAGVGKKGRLVIHVQVLAAPLVLEQAIDACFEETTTIGLRYHMVSGATLARRIEPVEVDGRIIRVKSARRPDGGLTAKAEAADLACEGGHAARMRLRARAERAALDGRAPPAQTTRLAREESGGGEP